MFQVEFNETRSDMSTEQVLQTISVKSKQRNAKNMLPFYSTIYSLSKKVTKMSIRYWILRVSTDIDFTQTGKLFLMIQNSFLTGLTEK